MKKQDYAGLFRYIKGILFITIFAFIILPPVKAGAAENTHTYKDGICCYEILNEEKKEAVLMGFESTQALQELIIPGSVIIDGTEYKVVNMDVQWPYYEENSEYDTFYKSVTKIIFAENYTGSLSIWQSIFKNLNTIEFKGKTAPEEIIINQFSRSYCSDLLFIVPENTETVYSKAIHEYMDYSVWSDLYEHTIELTPTIAVAGAKDIEYGCFSKDGLIYQVTSSAKVKTGSVQLIGVTDRLDYSYLALPEEVTNNGYIYRLTKLCKFGLIACGATAVKVPDTVIEMESGVFDYKVELLYLSKNCKVIPSFLTTDENNISNLRFVYVPEGVTTISAWAFYGSSDNVNSVILPSTIESLGDKALYGFDLVTFLNKKPIKNIAQAIKSSTTVNINKTSVTSYKSVLGSKFKVVEAKNAVKSSKLTVSKTSLKLDTYKTYQIIGTLTKGSNETVYWLSSNPDIFELSSDGTINPKLAGTAYAIAYTRTSGLFQAVKITVTNKLITKDIYTYRINNARLKTVSLYAVKPKKTTKELSIAEAIQFSNTSYKVTGVCADPSNPKIPIISDEYSDNVITKITFPKTITEEVGYLGILDKIQNIVFLGKKAPKWIRNWNEDDGRFIFQAVIYVPKGCVNDYQSVISYNYDSYEESLASYSMVKYSCFVDIQVLEAGSTQPERFVVDGVLYQVTKKAGTKNGIVTVLGTDVNRKDIVLNSTVKYGNYTYDLITDK